MNDFVERFLCQGAWKKKPKIELSQRMMLKSFPSINFGRHYYLDGHYRILVSPMMTDIFQLL